MEIPPISITCQTIDTTTVKDAVEHHIGVKCIKDVDSVYISDTLMTHYITFKPTPLTNAVKTFIKELSGCVPIHYKHHTFMAISNMYDV